MDNSQPIEHTEDDTIGYVKNCARCRGEHKIKYMVFSIQKPPGYDMWAMCPQTDEPILIKILPESSKTVDA